ncbi:MAG: hypothetical protein HYV60_11725 [Planctomycetia bacterium]|nr:hypothetical protein [Planctomycetia bacterium]
MNSRHRNPFATAGQNELAGVRSCVDKEQDLTATIAFPSLFALLRRHQQASQRGIVSAPIDGDAQGIEPADVGQAILDERLAGEKVLAANRWLRSAELCQALEEPHKLGIFLD